MPRDLSLLEECKQTMIDLSEMTSLSVTLTPHGTLPVCFTDVAVSLWYNDDSKVKDVFSPYVMTVNRCLYSPMTVPLSFGSFNFGINKLLLDPLYQGL